MRLLPLPLLLAACAGSAGSPPAGAPPADGSGAPVYPADGAARQALDAAGQAFGQYDQALLQASLRARGWSAVTVERRNPEGPQGDATHVYLRTAGSDAAPAAYRDAEGNVFELRVHRTCAEARTITYPGQLPASGTGVAPAPTAYFAVVPGGGKLVPPRPIEIHAQRCLEIVPAGGYAYPPSAPPAPR